MIPLYMASRRANEYARALGLRTNGPARLPWPADVSPATVAVSWPRKSVDRWARQGVPLKQADNLAMACGVHPCEWWPQWFLLGDPLELAEAAL